VRKRVTDLNPVQNQTKKKAPGRFTSDVRRARPQEIRAAKGRKDNRLYRELPSQKEQTVKEKWDKEKREQTSSEVIQIREKRSSSINDWILSVENGGT